MKMTQWAKLPTGISLYLISLCVLVSSIVTVFVPSCCAVMDISWSPPPKKSHLLSEILQFFGHSVGQFTRSPGLQTFKGVLIHQQPVPRPSVQKFFCLLKSITRVSRLLICARKPTSSGRGTLPQMLGMIQLQNLRESYYIVICSTGSKNSKTICMAAHLLKLPLY